MQGQTWIADRLPHDPLEARNHLFHRSPVKQISVILQRTIDTQRIASWSGSLAKTESEVELGGNFRQRLNGNLQFRQRHANIGSVLQNEHHLKERMAIE